MNTFNNNNEYIFWKVINNRYLFNKIIFSIEDIYYDYKDMSKYYLGHKIKFKYISTLKFLNKNDNQHWSILKDKLISNQLLKVDKESINEFIYYCKSKDILELFIEKKRDSIPLDLDLISISLENNNMVAFQLFLDYGYQITSRSIERAIHFGNLDALKVINSCNQKKIVVEQKYWLRLFRNKYVQLEMIEFFISINEDIVLECYGRQLQDKDKLDFTSFYSIKSLNIKLKLLEFDLVEKNEVSTFFIYYIKNSNFGLIKTSSELLFYIKSFYSLCCNQKSIPINIQMIIDNIKSSTLDEKEILYQLNLILLEQVQSKLHPSQYSNEMKSFFYHFLLSNKSINGIHYIPSIYFYTFTTFSIEGLQYLLDQYARAECIFNEYNSNPLDQNILKNHQDRVFAFMSLYYSQDIFKVPNEKLIVKSILLNCDIVVLKSLLGIKKFKDQLINLKFESYEEFTFNKYKLIINEIQNQLIINTTTTASSDSSNLKIKISFNNQNEIIEYIDFINEKWLSIINKMNNSGIGSNGNNKQLINSTFQTFIYPLLYSIDSKDTMKYLINNYIKQLIECKEYEQLFIQLVPFLFEYSILNSDIETLQFVQDKVGVQLNSYRGLFYKTTFKKSKQDAIILLNHINNHHSYYQNHFYNIYQMFANQFERSIIIQDQLDLNKFQRGISQVIHFSLVYYDFEFIKQIFNNTGYVINGNTFNQDNNLDNDQQFQTIFSVYKKSIYTIDSNETINFNTIINFIQYLLDKVKNQESRSLFLHSVLNYLYKIVLRIKDINLNKVEMLHQLLKDNQINIQLELYHVLYYIHLKSPKLFKYFYSNLNIINNITINGIDNNGSSGSLQLNNFNFEDIVSSKCTFEVLFFKIKDNLISIINQQQQQQQHHHHHLNINNSFTSSNYNFLFNETLSNIKYLLEVNEYNIIINNLEKFTLSNSVQDDLNALDIRNAIILNFLKELFTFIEIELFIQINLCIGASQDLINIAANYNNRYDILNYYNNNNSNNNHCTRIE